MNVAERTHANAPAETARWLERFAEALRGERYAMPRPRCSSRTGSGATSSPSPGPSRRCPAAPRSPRGSTRPLPRTQAGDFHIPPQRTPPRWVTRAGTQCIEALFAFETALGRCNGVLRLVPDAGAGTLRAWTLITMLEELKGHEEAFKRRTPDDEAGLRDYRRPELARPPQAGGALRRSRARRRRGRRRPGRTVDCRAADATRRRHA